MKRIWGKNIERSVMLFVILLSVAAADSDIYAEENPVSGRGKKYIFSYDQEIPTLIRYGDKVAGVMSKTGYIGFIQRDDGKSRSTIDIGYNITLYQLQEPHHIVRLISIFGLGYVPFLELLGLPGFFITDRKVKGEGEGVGFSMISPLAGYSYSRQATSWVTLGFSIHGGPAYCSTTKPWSSREAFEKHYEKQNNEMWYDYDAWVAAYDAIGNISGKWGARVNSKLKLYFLNFSENTVHIGLGIGYTQYIFADNHFNSYDIGIDFTMPY